VREDFVVRVRVRVRVRARAGAGRVRAVAGSRVSVRCYVAVGDPGHTLVPVSL